MRRNSTGRAALALLLAGVAALALAASQAGGGESEENRRQAARPDPPAAPGGAGMWVALDPETGALIQSPDELDTAARDPRGSLSTYGRDLVQEPLPQGGFKVDLQGRFQSAVVATIDPVTDEVQVDCLADHGPGGSEGGHDH